MYPYYEYNVCVLCNSCDESVCHLFFLCKTTCGIWNLCDKWLNPKPVHHNLAREHFFDVHLGRATSKGRLVSNTVWILIIWHV